MSNTPDLRVAEVARAGNLVMATCLDCWHSGVFDPRILMATCGDEVTLGDLEKRLKCRCGSRRCDAGVRLGETWHAKAPTKWPAPRGADTK